MEPGTRVVAAKELAIREAFGALGTVQDKTPTNGDDVSVLWDSHSWPRTYPLDYVQPVDPIPDHKGDYDLEFDVDRAVEGAFLEGLNVGWGEAEINVGRHAGEFL